MQCPDEKSLIDYVHGEGPEPERRALEAHLKTCPACAQSASVLQTAQTRLRRWKDADLPGDLHGRVMAVVQRENLKARGISMWRWLWTEIRPAVCGIALAVLWVLLHAPSDQTGSPQMMLACGIVWGATYNSLFRLIFTDRLKQTLMNWKIAGVAGLCALSLAMLIAAVTPNPLPFETRRWYMWLAPSIPQWTALVLPAFYSLVSLLIVSTIIGMTQKSDARRLILATSIVYAALMTLDLWACYVLDTGTIRLPILALWIASVWGVSLGVAWTAGLVVARRGKD